MCANSHHQLLSRNVTLKWQILKLLAEKISLFGLNRPGQLAKNSERTERDFFSLFIHDITSLQTFTGKTLFSLQGGFAVILFFLTMKSLSVEMSCLLGIQNEIQAVCIY